MNCLRTYYEKIGDKYCISAGKSYCGYSDEISIFVDCMDLETFEEVESIEVDFCNMFSAFCDMCRKYDV